MQSMMYSRLSELRRKRAQQRARRRRARRMRASLFLSLLAHAAALAFLAYSTFTPAAIPPPARPLPSGETAYAVFLPAPSKAAPRAEPAQPVSRSAPSEESVALSEAQESTPSSQAAEQPPEPAPEEKPQPAEETNASDPAVETDLPALEPLPLTPVSAQRSGILTSPRPLSREFSERRGMSEGASPSPSESSAPAPESPASAEAGSIGEALQVIAESVGGKEARPADIVFLLDLSGSMANNIHAVRANLSAMSQELKRRKVDATFGVVKFKVTKFLVFPQSTDIAQYERLLANVKVGGNEHALTALHRAMEKVKFRADVERRFILITDEPLEGAPSFTEILPALMRRKIVVDVIGLDIPQHRLLARGTRGLWHLIPGDG